MLLIYLSASMKLEIEYKKVLGSSFKIILHYGILRKQVKIFIPVISQLDAQNFCFTITLFHASTCFEHHVLIIRRSKLHYTASGIITPMGVHQVG